MGTGPATPAGAAEKPDELGVTERGERPGTDPTKPTKSDKPPGVFDEEVMGTGPAGSPQEQLDTIENLEQQIKALRTTKIESSNPNYDTLSQMNQAKIQKLKGDIDLLKTRELVAKNAATAAERREESKIQKELAAKVAEEEASRAAEMERLLATNTQGEQDDYHVRSTETREMNIEVSDTISINEDTSVLYARLNGNDSLLLKTSIEGMGLKAQIHNSETEKESEQLLFNAIKELLNYSSSPPDNNIKIFNKLTLSLSEPKIYIHHTKLFQNILKKLITNNIYYKNIESLIKIIQNRTGLHNETRWIAKILYLATQIKKFKKGTNKYSSEEDIHQEKIDSSISEDDSYTIHGNSSSSNSDSASKNNYFSNILTYLTLSQFLIQLHKNISIAITNKEVNKVRLDILNLFLNEINNNRNHTLAIRIRDDLNVENDEDQIIYIDNRAVPIYISEMRQSESYEFKVLSSLFGNNILSKILSDNEYGENMKSMLQSQNPKINTNHKYNENLTKFLTDQNNSLLFTYGASGSGKTYYTIGPGNGTKGLANYLLDIIKNRGSIKTIAVHELIPNYKIDKIQKDGCKGLTKYINKIWTSEPESPEPEPESGTKRSNKKNRGKYQGGAEKPLDTNTIVKIFDSENDTRLTYYTPNNPDSSRSHLVIKITYTDESKESEEKTVSIIDLAGLEAPIKASDQFDKGHQVLSRKLILEEDNKTIPFKVPNKSFYYPKFKGDTVPTDIYETEKDISGNKKKNNLFESSNNIDNITFLSFRPNKLGEIIKLWDNIQKIHAQITRAPPPYFIDGENLMDIFTDDGEFNKQLRLSIEYIFTRKNYTYAGLNDDSEFYMNLPDEGDGDVEMNIKGEKFLKKNTAIQEDPTITRIKKYSYYRNLTDFSQGTSFEILFNDYIDIIKSGTTEADSLAIDDLINGDIDLDRSGIRWEENGSPIDDINKIFIEEEVLQSTFQKERYMTEEAGEEHLKRLQVFIPSNYFSYTRGTSKFYLEGKDLALKSHRKEYVAWEYPQIWVKKLKENVKPFLEIKFKNVTSRIRINLKYNKNTYQSVRIRGGKLKWAANSPGWWWRGVKEETELITWTNEMDWGVGPRKLRQIIEMLNLKDYPNGGSEATVDNSALWEEFAEKCVGEAHISTPEIITQFKTPPPTEVLNEFKFHMTGSENIPITSIMKNEQDRLYRKFKDMWSLKIVEENGLVTEQNNQSTKRVEFMEKQRIDKEVEKKGTVNKMANFVFDIYIYMNRLYEGKIIQDTLTYITYKMKDINKNNNLSLTYWNPKCENVEQLSNLENNAGEE